MRDLVRIIPESPRPLRYEVLTFGAELYRMFVCPIVTVDVVPVT